MILQQLQTKVKWDSSARIVKIWRGVGGGVVELPCWIFTTAPRLSAVFLHWQHQLLLIRAHAILFRHIAHIRLWLHSQNKWASLRRHYLTREAVVKMGFMEIWNSIFTLPWILSRSIFNQSIITKWCFCVLLLLTSNKLSDLTARHSDYRVMGTKGWHKGRDLITRISSVQ